MEGRSDVKSRLVVRPYHITVHATLAKCSKRSMLFLAIAVLLHRACCSNKDDVVAVLVPPGFCYAT